uniref:Reverse transcriptase domain-containing protein n=1 Tax=Leptobrachium leishanense TaxID=445787 RepID=A0A8C5LYI6_9ANUR
MVFDSELICTLNLRLYSLTCCIYTVFTVLELSTILQMWNTILANVVPIYKKGSREESGNYRPVSLTSVVGKLMETMLKERIVEHLKTHRLQDQKQHGFTSGRSCQTNLIDFFDWVTKIIDTGGAVDIAYLDFSKAFDTVPHRRLINKLQSLSLDSNIVDWIRQWLSDRQQRVVVNGVYSAQGLVTSGVPQGSVLGPILFNIFISDIAEGINGKVCLFADDTKICNRVDVPGGISQMTNDLGKLKKWSELWQLSFNVDKCKIMHLGRKNPRVEYRIFDTVLTSTSEDRDLGVIISEDLRVSSQCNRAAGNASRMLGCVGRGISSRKREVLMPLYRALVRPHLEYCVQYWRPYLQKDIDILERVQRRATKMVYGLKEKSYQERLNDLNMYSLEKRRDRGDMIETFKYVKGIHKVEEGSIFKRKQNSKTRGHSLRLEGQRFKSNIRKHYFTERVVDTWNSLPVEVVEAKTVIEFKQAWDRHKVILNKR